MEKTTTTQPQLGTWDKLTTTDVEKAPKVTFEINIPVSVEFKEDNPREFQGETGAFYVFDVKVGTEDKAIVTGAWSLLRALKTMTPLKGKKAEIVKKLVKGKQNFEVKQL
jgi:hypothetical protein